MFPWAATCSRGPVGQSVAAGLEVTVPAERVVASSVGGECGDPPGPEGGEFLDQGAMLLPAGRDGSVVESVAVGDPADPVLELLTSVGEFVVAEDRPADRDGGELVGDPGHAVEEPLVARWGSVHRLGDLHSPARLRRARAAWAT